MVWKKDDFECQECAHVFEELYKKAELDQVACPECESTELTKLLSAPGLQTYSIMDADGKRQHLLKRSAEHTQGLIDKEPEKFKAGIGLERRTKKTQVGYGD